MTGGDMKQYTEGSGADALGTTEVTTFDPDYKPGENRAQ
jgi:hypothetical protein